MSIAFKWSVNKIQVIPAEKRKTNRTCFTLGVIKTKLLDKAKV